MELEQIVPTKQKLTLADLDSAPLFRECNLPPYCDTVVDFLNNISKQIFSSSVHSQDPELSALAFWLRRGNIIPLIRTRISHNEAGNVIKRSRGVVFLTPPTNVGSLFCYQLALALLTGNKTIIRLSPNAPEISYLLCDLIKNLLNDQINKKISENLRIFSYDHQREITEYFSRECDLRVIWGGDQTIRQIRQVPLAPKAMDISFADRFSWSLINAKYFLGTTKDQQKKIAQQLYNDITLFDQKACTSPKILCWIGDDNHLVPAKKKLHVLLDTVNQNHHYSQEIGNSVEKQDSLYSLMALLDKSSLHYGSSNISILDMVTFNKENLQSIHEHHHGNGLLVETSLSKISDIQPLLTAKEQTLAYFGYSEADIITLINNSTELFFDNITPIGQSHAFSHIWDGYDLFDIYQRDIRLNKL
ncbi:hypothetical protein A9Q97_07265 [Rhodospirillales bacterium 47_12_T64]|nr:hypothetical protein A9Q97_07265 [Rhodospirillales bacterium 47_12_T64]